MAGISEYYFKLLQDFQDRPLILASTWTTRSIRDLRSLAVKSHVLTVADKIAIFFRGMLAALIWLPLHLIAVPYTLVMGALQKKYQNLSLVPKLHEITPGLFLGCIEAATNESILKQHAITSVLSLVDFAVNVPKNQVLKHLFIEMKDEPDFDIKPVIEKATTFVNKARLKERKVLVHCRMGKSRSAVVMVALVQKILGLELLAALNYVYDKRPGVSINYGFQQQLFRLTDKH